MAATGTNDPIQYACQQNFTIMTTDGYWNGQTESSGPGLYGGGLMLDGATKVGQQDGDPVTASDGAGCPLSDPYCPRPIWDGVAGSVKVVTNKTNAYTDNVCSTGSMYRENFQTQREVSMTTRDYTRTTKRVIQYFEAKSQALARTTQTSSTQTYDMRSTEQFVKRKTHFVEEKYQHIKWEEQTTKVTEQWELQTTQAQAQTFQTREVQKRYLQHQEQWTTAKSQSVMTTTQYVMQKDQYRLGVAQILERKYQVIAYDWDNEHGPAVSGTCVSSPGNRPIECRIYDVAAGQFVSDLSAVSARYVDPSTCTTGPAETIGSGPAFNRTTCTDGPSARPYGPVASCTPGTIAPNSGNNYAASTCDRVTVDAAAAFNGTCSVGTTQGAGPDFYLYICTRPAGNNQSTPVASCGASSPGTAPDWITTTCSQPPGPNNFAATPSPACTVGTTTDASFVSTTCDKPLDSSTYVAACTNNPGTACPFIKTTCTLEVLSDVAVASASCMPGTAGAVVTTCPQTAAGPYVAQTPVAACVNGTTTGSPDYYETTCTYPPANNQTVFTTAALCGTPGVTPGTSPSWITRDCRQPAGANNTSVLADPRTCVANPGTSSPFLKVTCNTVQTLPPDAVPPASCPLGPGGTNRVTYGGPNNSIATHCDKQGVGGPMDLAACSSPTDPNVPPYIVTSCGSTSIDIPVASCVEGPLPPEGIDTVVCVRATTPPTQVATCSAGTDANFITTSCAGPTTTSAVAVDPLSCPDGTYLTPTYILTCSTSPIGPYTTDTPVASCSAGTDPSFITTTCSYPPANNYAATPVAPCTEGSTTDGSTQVKTVCSKTDVTNYVPTSACPASVAQSGTGPEIICNTVTTTADPVASCSVGVGIAPFFDTTTACTPVVTSPMADYAGACTPGPTATPGESVRCGLRPLGVPVDDSACAAGTNTSTGLVTQCTPSGGTGHLYTVVTTKTVTTASFSGTVQIGPANVVTTSTAPVQVDGTCYPTAQSFTAQPPVDIAGCSAWPCTQVTTSPGGSQNSLADVASYYYKTDLRSGLDGTLAMDNIVPKAGPGPEDDNATHQHMTTFAIALGVSGTLNFQLRLPQRLDAGRRLRRHPQRSEELATVAGSGARLLVRQPRQLQQFEVDRRLLAHRGQRARALLQRRQPDLGRC